MNREFGYPAYGPDSVQILTTVGGPYGDALMDTSACHLEAGQEKSFFRLMLSFYAGRLLTLGVEELLLFVFITWLGFNSMAVKIVAQIVVIVLNYVISKLLVFRNKGEKA